MEKEPKMVGQQNIENTKESKETKSKIKIEFAGKEYEIETTSYDFEYPEGIQKESGILGYKRTIIFGEEMLNIVRNHCANFGVDTNGYKDIESIGLLFWKILRKKQIEFGYNEREGRFSSIENEEQWKSYLETEEGQFFINSGIFSEHDWSKKLDRIFSNGEYPDRTMNHCMGAHQYEEKHSENFVQNKFFVQKLFDIDLAKKVKLGKRQDNADVSYGPTMSVYNKNNKEHIVNTDTHNLSKYENEIHNNEIFLIGYDAFNTSVKNFWRGENISFGFTLNDSLFKKYIKEAYEIFLENNFDTESELMGIEQIIRMIAFCNNDFYEKYKDFIDKSGLLKLLRNEKFDDFNSKEYELEIELKDKEKELSQKFDEIIKNFLPNIDRDKAILKKHARYSKPFLNKIKNVMNKQINHEDHLNPYCSTRKFLDSMFGNIYSSDQSDEIRIPIFINHDKIPQISWGHAKYAHFFNKKGFNFFEFKHSENLPEPINNKA